MIKHRWSLRDNRTHRCLTCEVVHLHQTFSFINIQIYISLTQVGNKHGNVTRIASSKCILIPIHYHPIGHELKLSPWIYIQCRGRRWCFICNVWVATKASTIELGQLWKVKAIHGESIGIGICTTEQRAIKNNDDSDRGKCFYSRGKFLPSKWSIWYTPWATQGISTYKEGWKLPARKNPWWRIFRQSERRSSCPHWGKGK